MTPRQACLAVAVLLLAAAATILALRTVASKEPDLPHVVRIGTMTVERAAHQATLLPDGQVQAPVLRRPGAQREATPGGDRVGRRGGSDAAGDRAGAPEDGAA
jgi:hypothetical protein